MCLIGEAFDCFDSICGAVVNIRNKGDKIAIWTNDSKNEARTTASFICEGLICLFFRMSSWMLVISCAKA